MNYLKRVWAKLASSNVLRKAFHTFWQAFSIVFLAGISNVLSAFAHGGLAATQAALLALVIAAGAAGLSALKTGIINLNRDKVQ